MCPADRIVQLARAKLLLRVRMNCARRELSAFNASGLIREASIKNHSTSIERLVGE
jgi:hypothetical protein